MFLEVFACQRHVAMLLSTVEACCGSQRVCLRCVARISRVFTLLCAHTCACTRVDANFAISCSFCVRTCCVFTCMSRSTHVSHPSHHMPLQHAILAVLAAYMCSICVVYMLSHLYMLSHTCSATLHLPHHLYHSYTCSPTLHMLYYSYSTSTTTAMSCTHHCSVLAVLTQSHSQPMFSHNTATLPHPPVSSPHHSFSLIYHLYIP